MKHDIFFNNELNFEIYVIGYKDKGECILFFLKADRNIVYSGMVDCYKDSVRNEAIEIFEEQGVDRLDFVCWTHPHDDHTVGMQDIISDYCDSDTYFWMSPIGSTETSDFAKEVQQTYSQLFSIIRSQQRKKMRVNMVANSMTLESFKCMKTDGFHKYRFNISSFAPSGELLTANMVKDIKTGGNLYSIGLIISIGMFNILLGGDVENRTLQIIPEYNLCESVDFIKIPHHSSETGQDIIKKLHNMDVDAPSVAVTTVYRIHSLPDPNVIDIYKRWDPRLKVYSSGHLDKESDEDRIGIIQTKFDILEEEEDAIEIYLKGNAVEL